MVELGLLGGVAVFAGIGHWLVGGKPSGHPAVAMQEVPLKEGEIELQDVQSGPQEGLVWIDARPEAKWREDGLPEALSITLQSELEVGEQLIIHQDVLSGASRVVIYCDDVFCSSSHDLAKQLRGEYRDFLSGEILVLHGGIVALREAGLARNSSPGS